MKEIEAVDVILPQKLQAFIQNGRPGQRLAYHVGLLATDKQECRPLADVANAIWAAFEEGKVRLLQKRYSEHAVIYFAEHR